MPERRSGSSPRLPSSPSPTTRDWLALATFLCAACATHPPAPVASASPDAPVDAPRPPTSVRAPRASAEAKDRADLAVTASAELLAAAEVACGERWAGNETCAEERFLERASLYQAYYATEADPRRTDGRIDAVPRLGGEGVTAAELARRLADACSYRCAARRLMTVSEATDAAASACIRKGSGHAACVSLGARARKTLSQAQAQDIEDTCKGNCDNERDAAAARRRFDAGRPRTEEQARVCAAACEKAHDGGWCGTDLIACLSRCVVRK